MEIFRSLDIWKFIFLFKIFCTRRCFVSVKRTIWSFNGSGRPILKGREVTRDLTTPQENSLYAITPVLWRMCRKKASAINASLIMYGLSFALTGALNERSMVTSNIQIYQTINIEITLGSNVTGIFCMSFWYGLALMALALWCFYIYSVATRT